MNFYDLIKNFYCTRRAALNAILNDEINDEIVRSSSDDTENFTEPSGGKKGVSCTHRVSLALNSNYPSISEGALRF